MEWWKGVAPGTVIKANGSARAARMPGKRSSTGPISIARLMPISGRCSHFQLFQTRRRWPPLSSSSLTSSYVLLLATSQSVSFDEQGLHPRSCSFVRVGTLPHTSNDQEVKNNFQEGTKWRFPCSAHSAESIELEFSP